jgi:hypothetical protein
VRKERTAPAIVLMSSDSEDETLFSMSGTDWIYGMTPAV